MEEERLLRLCRRLVDPDGTEDVQQHQELLHHQDGQIQDTEISC